MFEVGGLGFRRFERRRWARLEVVWIVVSGAHLLVVG